MRGLAEAAGGRKNLSIGPPVVWAAWGLLPMYTWLFVTGPVNTLKLIVGGEEPAGKVKLLPVITAAAQSVMVATGGSVGVGDGGLWPSSGAAVESRHQNAGDKADV